MIGILGMWLEIGTCLEKCQEWKARGNMSYRVHGRLPRVKLKKLNLSSGGRDDSDNDG